MVPSEPLPHRRPRLIPGAASPANLNPLPLFLGLSAMDRSLHIGLDPGESNRTAVSILDGLGNFVDAGFFEGPLPSDLIRRITDWLAAGDCVAVAIDGPAHPLSRPRYWDWLPAANRWVRSLRPSPAGRHAEIILRAHGFHTTRWTGLASSAATASPDSVSALYARCQAIPRLQVREVCAQVSIFAFDALSPEPDYPDAPEANLTHAALAASTSREFSLGRGMEVGGGDGSGAILLPRPLSPLIPGVLHWPEMEAGGAATAG